MARKDRAMLIVGGVVVIGGLYFLTRSSTPTVAQGTGVQGTANALTGLLGAVSHVFGGTTTAGQPGASSATPPQVNTPTIWPQDTSIGANGLPCSDPSNSDNENCGSMNAVATPSPNATTLTNPTSALPDFTPGGVTIDGSAYSGATQAPTPDPTYQDYSIPTVLA